MKCIPRVHLYVHQCIDESNYEIGEVFIEKKKFKYMKREFIYLYANSTSNTEHIHKLESFSVLS